MEDTGVQGTDLDITTILSVAALIGAFVVMKYLPKLLAGVPFEAPADLKARLDRGEDLLVVDVRTAAEFTGPDGHVAGSLNLPLSELGERLKSLSGKLEPHRTAPVYLMCRTANRAAHAARIFVKSGFTDVKVVDGGMVRWSRQGLPSSRYD
ncbi:MAG: rhodanese-like domain-containing protein [Alphaproteobacteria bacterium]